MKSIVFIVPHRLNRSPSQRFRFEQYLNYLKEKGWSYRISNLLNKKQDHYFYRKGYYYQKGIILILNLINRIYDAFTIKKNEIVFIQRESMFIGTNIFERIIRHRGIKIIFDFDDTLWKLDTSNANQNFEWLKSEKKVSVAICFANIVIAGNKYLANYAYQYNKSVSIIPTTIDTKYHIPKKIKKDKICIGWTGSITTVKHFEIIVPLLIELQKKYNNIYFKLIGDATYSNKELNLAGTPWKQETEIEDLQEIDIGIMPLPNDEWSKGKCGFKGLQYMALEIPTVMSPVGVNTEIIEDGVNGFLANTLQEWIDKLSQLIESEELRSNLGKAGRKTVIEKYSVESQKEKYLETINSVLS